MYVCMYMRAHFPETHRIYYFYILKNYIIEIIIKRNFLNAMWYPALYRVTKKVMKLKSVT